MINEKKALLLIGSPKISNSTSEALGSYLLESLGKKEYALEKLDVNSTLKKDVQLLIDRVNDVDILIISFPLYVDSPPAPLIRAMELIAEHRKEKPTVRNQSLIAIANCGFPEAAHNDTALRLCKNFADKAGLKWMGGLSMGAGPSINGRDITQLGGMTKNIVKALDLVSEAIVKDESIPYKAIEMMSKNLFPVYVYTFLVNRLWKTQARQYNMHKHLYAKPYIKK